MKRKKSENRIEGVAFCVDRKLWRVRYIEEGVAHDEYRHTKEAAEARAEELAPILGNRPAPEKLIEGGTRAEWIERLWTQIKRIQDNTDPDILNEGLDAMSKAYKIIREDLEAMEAGKVKPEEPSELSDEELEAKLIQLKAVGNDG